MKIALHESLPLAVAAAGLATLGPQQDTVEYIRQLITPLNKSRLHDRLGFDHRNAVDVAVHPDRVEGRALLDHLRTRGIPYLGFRGRLAGASTGTHVHVGAACPRLN